MGSVPGASERNTSLPERPMWLLPTWCESSRRQARQRSCFPTSLCVALADRTKVRGCFALWKRTRHILALAFDYHMRASLVTTALEMVSFPVDEKIFHSDQGKQFGAEETRTQLLEKGFQLSM